MDYINLYIIKFVANRALICLFSFISLQTGLSMKSHDLAVKCIIYLLRNSWFSKQNF